MCVIIYRHQVVCQLCRLWIGSNRGKKVLTCIDNFIPNMGVFISETTFKEQEIIFRIVQVSTSGSVV